MGCPSPSLYTQMGICAQASELGVSSVGAALAGFAPSRLIGAVSALPGAHR